VMGLDAVEGGVGHGIPPGCAFTCRTTIIRPSLMRFHRSARKAMRTTPAEPGTIVWAAATASPVQFKEAPPKHLNFRIGTIRTEATQGGTDAPSFSKSAAGMMRPSDPVPAGRP